MNGIDFQNDLLPLKNQLYRLALRIVLDAAEAEDVVEDTLIKVWEQGNALSDIQNLAAYCATICRNLALDKLKRKDRENVSLEQTDLQFEVNSLNAAEEMERSERLALVRKMFDQLPEKQRTALQLREIEEKSYEEVAEMMEISAADVKVTLHRARQRLKELLLRFKGKI